MKVSKELSIDYNRHPVGLKGGKGPSDINNKDANSLTAIHAEAISKALSGDSAKLTSKGSPDKDLFESSKP